MIMVMAGATTYIAVAGQDFVVKQQLADFNFIRLRGLKLVF